MQTLNIPSLAAFTAITLLTTACANNPTPEALQSRGLHPLDTTQLHQLYSKTLQFDWRNARSRSGSGEYQPNGEISIEWSGESFDGKWRILNNHFCATYASIHNGQEQCYVVYQTGARRYVAFLNGDYAYTFNIERMK